MKKNEDLLTKNGKCLNCGTAEWKIKTVPSRHLLSPRPYNDSQAWGGCKLPAFICFCSKKCADEHNSACYSWFAKLDRNCSDSECFESNGKWDGEYRLGKCVVTGREVRVIPQTPGDRSGQPEECYDHFVLRKKYQEILNKYA